MIANGQKPARTWLIQPEVIRRELGAAGWAMTEDELYLAHQLVYCLAKALVGVASSGHRSGLPHRGDAIGMQDGSRHG